MKTYQVDKLRLAKKVAQNMSLKTFYHVWVFFIRIRSVKSMKLEDTEVLQVCEHHELPARADVIAVFRKGKDLTSTSECISKK